MKHIALILISLTLVSCASDRVKPSRADGALLEDLIHENIIDQQNLRPGIPLRNREEIREAEAVYQTFWNPLNLKRYGELQWGYDLYTKARYLIIQTDIKIAVRKDSLWIPGNLEVQDILQQMHFLLESDRRFHLSDEQVWSLCEYHNFYPKITIPCHTVLHLTPKLKNDLLEYLGEDFTEFGTPSIMSTSRARNRSEERLAATKNKLVISLDHWGDGWHLISHPEILKLYFNHDLTKALVAFRIGYQGGYSYLTKNNDKWELIDSSVNWME